MTNKEIAEKIREASNELFRLGRQFEDDEAALPALIHNTLQNTSFTLDCLADVVETCVDEIRDPEEPESCGVC